MRRFIDTVLTLIVVCVPAVQAEEPGAAGRAAKDRVPEKKSVVEGPWVIRPQTGQKPFVPYDRMPRIHVTPHGIFYGTDEDLRKREAKRRLEEKKLREGMERVRQMKQEFSERKRKKTNATLIVVGIVVSVLFFRLVTAGSKPAK